MATTRSHGLFEGALADIQRQLPRDTVLKACIGCAYSDYPRPTAGCPDYAQRGAHAGYRGGFPDPHNGDALPVSPMQ